MKNVPFTCPGKQCLVLIWIWINHNEIYVQQTNITPQNWLTVMKLPLGKKKKNAAMFITSNIGMFSEIAG